MSKLISAYFRIVNRYPISAQCIQTGILMGTGDCLAQKVVAGNNAEYDIYRTINFACLGCFMVGPTVTVWYRFMSKMLDKPGQDRKIVALKKMVADQACFAPTFLAVMLTTLNVIKGKSWEDNKKTLKTQYPDILIANYKIWPAVQFVNFFFMPLNFQVVFAQIVALFWNTFISWRTSKES